MTEKASSLYKLGEIPHLVASSGDSNITPLSKDERTFISSHPTPPDPSSSLYIQRSTTLNKDGSEDHCISGVQVIFDPHATNNLHKQYSADHSRKISDSSDVKGTVRTLTLCADQLVIRGELFLPETNVNIFARELIFEDTDKQSGCIKTMPLEFELKKALDGNPSDNAFHESVPGKDGIPGLKAGDITLCINTLRLPKGKEEIKRFIMKGGDGQDAGHGKATKIDAQPAFPGVAGMGGKGGLFKVNKGVTVEVSNQRLPEGQDISQHMVNEGGRMGKSGLLADLPLLFRLPSDEKPLGPYPLVTEATSPITARLRKAFEEQGLPLGKKAFATGAEVCFCGIKLGTTGWGLPGGAGSLFDRVVLMAQFNFAPYMEAFKTARVPKEFVDKVVNYFKELSKVRPEKLKRLKALYGTFIPSSRAVVLAENDWKMRKNYHYEMEHNVENRWWIIEPATGATWVIENIKSYPGRASFHLVERYSILQKPDYCYVFRSGVQRCLDLSPILASSMPPILDQGKLPPPLCQELARRLTVGIQMASMVEVEILWLGHIWQFKYGSALVYLEYFPDIKSSPLRVSLLFYELDIDSSYRPRGKQSEVEMIEYSNAWLHPHQLQPTLEYIRDAYLSEQRKEAEIRLTDYHNALKLAPPTGDGWATEHHKDSYYSIRTEVATILHRLDSHLDYFGHPAGWAPTLSLQACLQLYKGELDRALKTLLIVTLIERQIKKKEDSATALDGALQSLNEETQGAVQQVQQGENRLNNLHQRVQSLKLELVQLQHDLRKRREELEKKAKKNIEKKAWIDFAFKTFSAVTSVIPVGQPALGAVGSLSNVVKDMATVDQLDHVGKIADILGDSTSSFLDAKSKDMLKEAKDKPEILRKKENAAKLNHVSKNLGPALGQINDAISGLRVPQGEVEAELARLEAGNQLFTDLVARVKMTNQTKSAFMSELDETIQTIGISYQRITSNCLAMTSLEHQRGNVLAKLDVDALYYIRGMGQRARQTVMKYLYIVMKSYETTLFEPLGNKDAGQENQVDFLLTKVFQKIIDLFDDADANNQPIDITRINAFAEATRVLFEDNLTQIERSILNRYLWTGKERWINDPAPEFRLSEEQTPKIIEELNTRGEAVVDLKQLSLIPPGYERVRIIQVDIIKDDKNKLEFDHQPSEGTVRLVIEALGDGTIRSDGKLYAVRHPGQLICGWAYHFSNDTLELGKKSLSSISLLRKLLEEKQGNPGDVDVKKYQIDLLTPPPAWSAVKIRYDRSDIISKNTTPPNLKSVLLRWHYDVIGANTEHRVLDVRTVAPRNILPLIECDQPDLGNNAQGFGNLYRIYNKGIQIKLTAPEEYGEMAFSHWRVYPERAVPRGVSLEKPGILVTLDYDTQVFCFFTLNKNKLQLPLLVRQAEAFSAIRKVPAFEREKMDQEVTAGKPTKPWCLSFIIRNKPSLQEGVFIGYLPQEVDYTLLEGPLREEEKEWLKIDFRGLVGWVESGSQKS